MVQRFSTQDVEALDDIEFVSLICLSRKPYGWERWRHLPLAAIRHAIRSIPGFTGTRTRSPVLANRSHDVVFPSETRTVRRAFSLLAGCDPSADELAVWLAKPEVSAIDLVAAVFHDAPGLEADGLIYDRGREKVEAYWSEMAVSASCVQQEVYNAHALGLLEMHTSAHVKLAALKGRSLKVVLHHFALDPADLALMTAAVRAESDVDVAISVVTSDKLVDGSLAECDLFITNNNGLYHQGRPVFDLVKDLPCVTVCWHWDNHHQFTFTRDITRAFDVVFPAHSNQQISLYDGKSIVGPCVPCCTFQWTSESVGELDVCKHDRNDRLYGRLNSYPGIIGLRDVFLKRAAAGLPDSEIIISDSTGNDWWGLSLSERFATLATHKAIICTPVFNDVPARLFDALLAGACPVVPLGLPDIDAAFSPADQASLGILKYLPESVSSLAKTHARAIEHFDNRGPAGVKARFDAIVSGHLAHHRASRIINETLQISASVG